MKKIIKGIWFIGKAGVGKTTASKLIRSGFDTSVLIDGDEVREYISFDLGYNLEDRLIQQKRVYGIAKIMLKNKLLPIISTVTMSKDIYNLCKLSKILVVNIKRDFSELKKIRKIYIEKQNSNVVGIDIPESINYDLQIVNDEKNFTKKINNIWKKFTLEN